MNGIRILNCPENCTYSGYSSAAKVLFLSESKRICFQHGLWSCSRFGCCSPKYAALRQGKRKNAMPCADLASCVYPVWLSNDAQACEHRKYAPFACTRFNFIFVFLSDFKCFKFTSLQKSGRGSGIIGRKV